MITYITETNVTFENVRTVNTLKGKELLTDFYKQKNVLAIDVETTGLDCYKHTLRLTGIGNKDEQFIIDNSTVELLKVLPTNYNRITYVGHNLKFDWSMLRINANITLDNLWDTMLAEQRITQGYEISRNLESTIERRLNIILDKSAVEDFTSNYFKLEYKHLEYLSNDIKYLLDLKDNQIQWIKKLKLENLLYQIEFPLIKVLAKAELEGFVLNTEKWLENIKRNEIIKFQKECELDEELRNLRDFKSGPLMENNPDIKLRLTGGRFDNKRVKAPNYSSISDLFGQPMSSQTLTGLKKKIKINPNNINWSSTTQLIDIFARLEEPLPTKNNEYKIPLFSDVKGAMKKSTDLNNSSSNFTTQSDFIEQYFIEKPNSLVNKLLKLLLEYREVETELSTFGMNFIDKINPITGKIHTVYRQCAASNGRLQSGGGKKEPDKYNSQNIPRKKEIRHCFGTDEGFSITTLDLSGAEATVMASKAQDFKLQKLVKTDIHSHLATIGFRNIYLFRAGDVLGLWDNLPDSNGDTPRHNTYSKVYNFFKRYKNPKILLEIKTCNKKNVQSNYNEAISFTVNKSENTNVRQMCKNLTFGSIYGCGPKKAAKTIDKSVQEGLIYLQTIKKELPNTFNMVEENAKFALDNGYLRLNNRTNSLIWFPSVLDAKKTGYDLDQSSKFEIDNRARNIPISGTQADMIKEAMVEVDNYFIKNNLPCLIIAQVHDELVVKHPTEMTWIPKTVSDIMINVCNKYLNGVQMETEYHTLKTWTK